MSGTNWGTTKGDVTVDIQSIKKIDVAHVWSTNAINISLEEMQHTHNEALRNITGSHKRPSIDHLHSETKMLQVEDHPKSSLCAISGTLSTHREWIIHREK